MSDAYALLCGLRLEDGRTWGEIAYDFQHADAQALIDTQPARHFWYATRCEQDQ